MNEMTYVVAKGDIMPLCLSMAVIIGFFLYAVPLIEKLLDSIFSKYHEITVVIPKSQYKEFRKFMREHGFDRDEFLCDCLKETIQFFSARTEYNEQNN